MLENPQQALREAGLAPGGVLLDIGTGTGYLAIAAAEIMGTGSTVYALDKYAPSIAALRQDSAAHDLKNIVAIIADAAIKIPVPRHTVDLCLMSNVVHGFSANAELDATLKQINAVLKEEGRIIVFEFKKIDNGFGPPISIKMSPQEVVDSMQPYGYALLKQFDVSAIQYGVVLQRISLQEKHC